ncbi:hypothetical protein, partial [Pseudomonas viridiflava]|uniref:hypothetical protein n=1 Tax=Pseudomonas viridiflava TaxID=33069 RepID=UPI0019CFF623
VWVTSEPDEKLGQVAKAYVVGDKKFDINYMSRRLVGFCPHHIFLQSGNTLKSSPHKLKSNIRFGITPI